jgi:hypothetical protein
MAILNIDVRVEEEEEKKQFPRKELDKLPLWRGMAAHCRGDLPKSSRRPTCATTRPPIQQLTTPTYLYLL